jgi:general secretion pathway protein C
MGFDALFKRYFAVVVCLLIGAAAYFQASGMGALVASSVALDPSSLPAAPRLPPRAAPAASSQDHTTTALAILERNPFDSVTGPLNGKILELPTAEPIKQIDRDPYQDPECDVAKVLLIMSADDPQWSFAALAGSDGKSVLRRQGDEMSGYTIDYIGDRRSAEDRQKETVFAVYDRVWLTSATGARCQLRMGGKGPAKTPPKDAAKPKSGLAKDLSDKIKKVGPNEFNVERSAVDMILENQAELMKSARIVPEKEGDKVVGVRLFGVRPDSLLGTLGIENGDRLSAINGFDITDPQKALEAYTKLRTADHLTVSVNRHGSPTNIDFNIK